jgi:hypothetical protein
MAGKMRTRPILANERQPAVLAVAQPHERPVAYRILAEVEDNFGVMEIGLAILPLELQSRQQVADEIEQQ